LPSHRNYFYLLVFPLMPLLPYKGLLAIATVVDVALQTEGRPISAKTLAKRHCLPPRHLELVLQSLVRSGILKGIRGPRGGYELARESHSVTANDILHAVSAFHEASETSELIVKVVLPFLSVAEQEFGQALSRIGLEDMVQRAASRDNGASRQESGVEATVKC
jgi:Rrf2 family transcriptional regulator, iron-sulfur cluster assembly transcription factor